MTSATSWAPQRATWRSRRILPPLLRRVLTYREGRFGVALLIIVAFIVIFGPLIAPYSPYATTGLPLSGPSAAHLLGTDELGRDVLSRVLAGGRDVVFLPVAGVIGAFLLGGITGLIAGYSGGWLDRVYASVVNVALSVPALLVVLILVGVGKDSALVIVIAIALVYAPGIARIVRGAAQAAGRSEYVDVARLRGESVMSIAVREVLPNVAGTVAVQLALSCTQAVLLLATLDFLGVGAQPPSSSWGLMIADGEQIVVLQPWTLIAPAVALIMLALAFNLVSGAMQRAIAERQR
jgi:peptide/nickel transport system permease protein